MVLRLLPGTRWMPPRRTARQAAARLLHFVSALQGDPPSAGADESIMAERQRSALDGPAIDQNATYAASLDTPPAEATARGGAGEDRATRGRTRFRVRPRTRPAHVRRAGVTVRT